MSTINKPLTHKIYLAGLHLLSWPAEYTILLAPWVLAACVLFNGALVFTLEPGTIMYWVCWAFVCCLLSLVLTMLWTMVWTVHDNPYGKAYLFCREILNVARWVVYPALLLSAWILYQQYDRGYLRIKTGATWLLLPIVALSCMALWLQHGKRHFGWNKEVIDVATWNSFRATGSTTMGMVGAAGESGERAQRPVVDIARPRLDFSKIFGMAELKSRLLEAGRPVFASRPKNGDDPRNGILLFGSPGNGKTAIAEALAGELKVKFLVLDYSKSVSQWIGETSRNIATAFEQARGAGPCVLFIDEIDSFIVSRDSASQNTAEASNIVNLLLTELVNIRRYPVLVVAATNRLAKLDNAAIREGRFDYKIEITPPDAPARLGLLQSTLQKHVKGIMVDDAAVKSAAERWDGFSVKRILAVGEEMPSYLREHPAQSIGYEQLMGALRRLQGRKGAVPANTKALGELVLPTETSRAIALIANRIRDPLRIEQLGGTLPGGILFFGPAGTGKTAVARALAKETGWAFLSVAGPDLMRDLDKMEELYAEAKDIRPCLIFIDEADDLLRDRQYSNASALTNKLLTLMDGASGRVKDVVFIAATNNPDQIDPAMLRAGRFTEKVPFFTAGAQAVGTLIERWVASHKAKLANEVVVDQLAEALEGQSPANIEGVMQYALNLAIDAHVAKDGEGQSVQITQEQVEQAMAVVLPS